MGNSDLQIATMYYFTCPVLNKKLQNFQENPPKKVCKEIYMAMHEGKKQSIRSFAWRSPYITCKKKDYSVHFSSVAQSRPTLCNHMNCSTPGLPVHHQLPEATQTHVHWVGDAIQAFHPLSSPSPPALNLSQRHGLFEWVSSSHQVAKVLEF